LFSKKIKVRDIPPRRFANAAKELNIGFQQLLAFISRLYAGGQNQSQFRVEAIMREASK